METGRLIERIQELLIKSRKAVRLYASMAKGSPSDFQIGEWRQANQTLVQELTELLSSSQKKTIGSQLYNLKEMFLSWWKQSDEEMKKKHFELTRSSENGDYIKAALLAQELVVLKARAQSSQAVAHEIGQILERSKVPSPPIQLVSEIKTGAKGVGKVIEFPKRATG